MPVITVTTAIVLDWPNTAPWGAWDEEVGDEARGVLVGGEVLVTGEVPVAEKGRGEEGVADGDRGVLVAEELLIV